MTVATLVHGGDLATAEARFGVPEGGWLDLSTGINPVPYPVPLLESATDTRLPDARAEHGLRRVAARYMGCPGFDNVALAPGSQALIQWLPRLTPPTTVALVEPTYGEHRAAWELAGHQVIGIAADELDAPPEDARVLVVANPNNPDGLIIEPKRLLDLADRFHKLGGLVVIDEAFADVMPGSSLARGAGHPALIVLRSFGKFFGLAGIRLGLALAAPARIAELARAIGPWPVSGAALAIATAAYDDELWIAATRKRLARDSRRLATRLVRHGLIIAGTTDLFVLAEHASAPELHAHLGRAGILVRAFPYRSDWLRFGLPGDDAGWERLEAALEAAKAE